MMKISRLTLIIFMLLSKSFSFAQTFQKTYGGANFDYFSSLIPTGNGDFVLLGSTSSFGERNANIYLICINGNGDTLWTNVIGGSSSESGYDIIQTSDGGYLLAGNTYSFGNGSGDGFLIKTDNKGRMLWSKTYGGIYNDDITSVQQSKDGGFILSGNTFSFGAGGFDILLIKTDKEGEIIWSKTYGGPAEDAISSFIQTKDGNYAITGQTSSFGAGQVDVFLMKINEDGDLLWFKTYGGTDGDVSSSLLQTMDGGYALAGTTFSFGAFSNDGDIYLIKTNETGDLIWSKTYGGPGTDRAKAIIQTKAGHFVITGETWSFGHGKNDVYLVKTDNKGQLIWSKTYGGSLFDYGKAIQSSWDGGFLIGAYTASSFGNRSADFYLIKTDSQANSGCNEMEVTTISTIPRTITADTLINTAFANVHITFPSFIEHQGGATHLLCNTLSINESINDKYGIEIYPNPAKNKVQLKYTNLHIRNLHLSDLPGRFLKTFPTESKSLDVSGLSPGIYFLQVTAKEGTIIEKVMIK